MCGIKIGAFHSFAFGFRKKVVVFFGRRVLSEVMSLSTAPSSVCFAAAAGFDAPDVLTSTVR